MTNGNNDVRELEDLLTELEGQGALPVGAYSEEDDVVTQLMDAPLGEQEWMVQVTPLDRRMMSTEQLFTELGTGHLVKRDMLVWRSGMSDWAPISSVDELRSGAPRAAAHAPVTDATLASIPDRRPAPLPPPAPVPPPRVPSSALGSPSPLGRVPLPPSPSAPFGAPKPPLSPVPDVPPPSNGLPLINSSFTSPSTNGAFAAPAASPAVNGAFNAPPPPPAAAASAGGLLPDLDSAFNLPPAAAVPVPPPVTARVNTQRPVAVDFSEMEPSRPAPLRVLVGSGIAAVLMIAGTVYALSAGGVFKSTPEQAPVAAASAKPAAAAAAPAVAATPEPKPAEAAPAAQTQPASVKEGEPSAAAEEKAAPEAKMAAADEPAEPAKAAEPAEAASDEAAAEPEKTESEKVAAKGEDPEEKPKAQSKSSSDDDAPASGRSARRTKAARGKKAEAKAAKEEPAPRRTKPRAAAVASAAPDAEESPKEQPSGSTFNRDAAKSALDDAAAQARNCRPAGGLTGSGKVQVRYEPNGKVGAVSILTPQFDNTTTGDCLVMVFRRANIPAFTGSPAVVMNKNFEIP